MPKFKSNAEKQADYRRRRKERMADGEWEEEKRSEAERSRLYRRRKKRRLTIGEKHALLDYECQRKRQQRLKKKRALGDTNRESFSSAQTKGRAIRKVEKVLPAQQSRKSEVLQHLLKEHSETLTPTSKKNFCDQVLGISRRRLIFRERKPRDDKIPDKTKLNIQQFYERDEISRVMPGKKDVKVVKIGASKEKKRKRILMMTTREAFALYKKEYPTQKVGKSNFQHLRPEWVLPTTGKDHDVCLCKYHENAELLLRKIRTFTDDLPLYVEELVKLSVCSMDDELCVDRACDECGVEKLRHHILEQIDDKDMDAIVIYYQWSVAQGRVIKDQIESDLISTIDELMEQVRPLSRHVYNVWRQHAELKDLKRRLQPGKIIIHEDFSENYSLKHQGEIQSAHWSNDSCTIFTAVVYYSEGEELKHFNYALVSNELCHNKEAVVGFNKILVRDLRERLCIPITHIHYWSDGAASQFKNKYCFANMLHHRQDFNATMDWSYFETAHGKGAVDGVGGTVKNVVWRAVLRKQEVVGDAAKFAYVAKCLCKDTNILYISAEMLKNETQNYDKRWNNCKAIQQTHKIHFVKPVDEKMIGAAVNTSYTDPVFTSYCIIKAPNNTNALENDVAVNNATDPVTPTNTRDLDIQIGQWYAAYFATFVYWYVGIVRELDDTRVHVDFLQQVDAGKNFFRSATDLNWVNSCDLFYKLKESPTPISASRSSTLVLHENDFHNIVELFCEKYENV